MTVMQPVWPARCEADNRAMLRYLEVRLFEIESKKLVTWHKDARVPHTDAERLDYAIKYAEAGDVRELRDELLRRIEDPRIGRFINLPKLRRANTGRSRRILGSAKQLLPCRLSASCYATTREEATAKGRRLVSEQFAAEIYNVC